jgi:hypothetical protein
MYFCKCVLELNFATINAWKSQIVKIVEPYYTVKRPKFGIGPYVRHPLYELLKNHIFAWAEVSDLVQRGEKLYIFFCTNKKINIWGSPYTIYDLQQLGPCMSKLGYEKCESVLFFLHEGYIFWGVFRVKKLCLKSA